ncbi:hypothetical protein L1987_76015 [Smallanthus sonchifolius]|uniref:Uncharacterized protein n=1 Tax=Smallanthus sonchifolius TaxID=185202 RepID=A0ACB9A7J9_9ASTR|nr:hypothetical protein L1987_76015 [Smallanthus sonchifolius]
MNKGTIFQNTQMQRWRNEPGGTHSRASLEQWRWSSSSVSTATLFNLIMDFHSLMPLLFHLFFYTTRSVSADASNSERNITH